MRCPDCNKFVSLDYEQEPEDMELDISSDGTITGSCTIYNNCADCGTALRTATVEFETSVDVDGHEGEGHELAIEEESTERTYEGGGRYQKSWYGVEVTANVTCSCGKLNKSLNFGGACAAGSMEEC